MRIQVVIPARYQSGRLPGKPMVKLLGVPMIERTWRRCIAAVPSEDVLIATDDERIFDHCRSVGARVEMTSPDCLTGTDRVAEIARRFPADYFVNVQGDEPLLNPDDLRRLVDAVPAHSDELLFGMCEITTEEQFRNPAVGKMVFRQDRRLLYMSRASIPTTKRGEFKQAWRPVAIYGFPPAALADYTASGKKTPIEAIEDHEIIRFLEMGYDVRLIEMSTDSIAVDMPADVEAVEARLRAIE